jgi:Family of unknown function (DUF5652)
MPLTQSMNVFNGWIAGHPYLVALGLVWSLAWKGFALWKAAERDQKAWFVFILILNTVGLLEIFYIFVIARKYKVEVVNS